jgi:hypothetical protein
MEKKIVSNESGWVTSGNAKKGSAGAQRRCGKE